MSVLGLDFGTTNLVIAVAQRGGVDILANEASARLTAALVSFDEKQRYAGESAQAVQMSNLKNTIGNVKQLLGRKWSDAQLQADLKLLGVCNEFVELPGDRVGVKVSYKGEEKVFSAEQLAGMLFAKLKETTEGATATKVKDVVVSVPGWFGEAQRKALLEAIHIGGMNALRIVNDLTALSLSWGLYKMDLDEKEPKKVMIVDLGEHAMSVGITEFTKSQAKVVSTAYNTEVSGGAIDFALATHFAEEFKTKRKIDLRQYPKSWFRLLSAVGKVKKILNANPSAPLNVECIYEEFDINSVITRDVYAELVKEVVAKVPKALDEAVSRAGLKFSDLHSIEIVGSASRTQVIQHAMTQHTGRELSQTLNAEEALAKGCALQCAILSPHFRVREYSLLDIVDHPIVCTWTTLNDPADTTEKHVTILNRTSTWPAAKNVNFHRPACKPFSVRIHYDSEFAPAGQNPTLSTVTIANVPTPAEGPDADVRLKIRKNVNGIIETAEAELVEKYEEVETPAPAAAPAAEGSPATPAADGSAAAAATPTTEGGSAMDVDQKAAAGAAEPIKKKKVRYTSIPFSVESSSGTSAATLAEWVKLEAKLSEETRLAVAVANAKNAVEAYVYDARDKLCTVWAPFVTESDAAAFNTLLDETGDWLYGEGEDQTREVYEKKLLAMKVLGDPIASRMHEEENRAQAISHFDKHHGDYHAKATDSSDKYDHIPAEDKDKVIAEINKNRLWLAPLMAKQQSSPQHADPHFYARDLHARVETLAKMADPVFNKPKPKPKPVETPKPAEESAKPAAGEGESPSTTPAPEQTPPAEEKPTEMEVD